MMRALEISGPNAVTELTIPIPEIEKDEALIRVAYSGICATDYEILSGEMSLVREGRIRYPVRIGHEWSGTIVKVGEAVTQFKIGDRVISDPGISCGKCEACRAGRYYECTHFRAVGTIDCWDGSFADYMKIPERHLHLLPGNISLKEAAIIEPSGIAYDAVQKMENVQGKIVLVIGTGAIGMAAAAFAKFRGAKTVILAGRTDAKLEIGRRMGADETVNIRNQDLMEYIMRATDGEGVDFTIETSGNREAVAQCPELTRMHGTVAYVGFYDRRIQDFPIDTVVSRELAVHGVMGHYGTPLKVIAAMQQGIALTPMITHVIPFREAKRALLDPKSISGTRIKVLVDMSIEND